MAKRQAKAKPTGGGPPAAVIVAGDDLLAVSETVDRLAAEALGTGDRAGMAATFDGREADVATVLDELRTFPLLGSRRVVVVESAREFVKRAGEALRRYLDQPAPTSALILVARGEKAPVSAFKTLAKAVKVIACPAPRRAGDRIQWLIGRARRREKVLAGADARLLLDLAGDDLVALDSEVEKLATYVGERRQIRRADIEALVAPARVEPVYELGDAVTARDRPRALRIAEDLLAEGVELTLIVGALRAHLRRFWQAKRHRQAGRSAAQAAEAMGEANRAWLIRKLYDQVHTLSEDALARAFEELHRADLDSKTGALPERTALERFIVAVT